MLSHLDALLAIDKTIDFVLIFVGLGAALALENHLASVATEKAYIETLARVHTEIALNKPLCNEYNDGIIAHSELAFDAADKANDGFSENIQGNSSIYEARPEKLQDKFFRTIHEDKFLNSVLLGELYHLYSIYDKLSNLYMEEEQLMFDLSDSYTSAYGKAFFGEEITIQDYMDFNIPYNKATKNMGRLQSDVMNAVATSTRMMNEIEHELAAHGVAIESARSIGDLYYLALNEMYRDSIQSEHWVDEGISRVEPLLNDKTNPHYEEYKSFAGRLFRVKCRLTMMKSDVAYWEEKSNVDQFEMHLNKFGKSGVYSMLYVLLGCEYWYEREDCEALGAFLDENWDPQFEWYEVQAMSSEFHLWRKCLNESLMKKLLEHPNISESSFAEPTLR